eukprot:TRINITY_DN565_c0_g1_i1.p1 TRINITY_DN565_c0_g1~~TRINITY_DN565_c0_g1_i1.p1  ORF type:complete len:525 (+),score=112.65 TRINITY_DN565_c0_g1_i1:69-1577(+)
MNDHPACLTIAGSDSGGGAGIQADLKTFHSLGVYGSSIIAALTAQNTLGVQSILRIETSFVESQMRSVLEDLEIKAIKTGMLHNSANVIAISNMIREHRIKNVVVDPVMMAKGGHHLLEDSGIEAYRTQLIPLSLIITPNAPEACLLLKRDPDSIKSIQDMKDAALELHESLHVPYVLIKGGHVMTSDEHGNPIAIDVLFDAVKNSYFQLENPRIQTKNTHGTGCTYSAAICSYLALGHSVGESVAKANAYVHNAILHAFPMGHGHGPLNHFSSNLIPSMTQTMSPSDGPTTFFQRLKLSCADRWTEYVDGPFVQRLKSRSLSLDGFKRYLVQDYLFLLEFARCHALFCAKSKNYEQMKSRSEKVQAMISEMQLHITVCQSLGMSWEELNSASSLPETRAYTDFLKEKSLHGDLEMAVAMAPCQIGYAEIGDAVFKTTEKKDDHFQRWIDTYAGVDFQSGVKTTMDELNELARGSSPEKFKELQVIFEDAVRLEIQFFSMAL